MTAGAPEGEGSSPLRSLSWRRFPRRVLAGFLAADAVVVGLYALVIAVGVPRREALFFIFDLNQEANLPSWYSSMQLLLIGAALLALATPLFRELPSVSGLRRLWLVLGSGFVYLSADEGGVIHEHVSQVLVERKAGGAAFFTSLLRTLGVEGRFRGGGVWIVVYVGIAVVLVALLAPMIRPALREWPRQSLLFLTGFGLLFAGGIVVEGVSNIVRFSGMAHLAEVGVEELLELGGATLLLYASTSVIAAAAQALQERAAAPEAEHGPEELPIAM